MKKIIDFKSFLNKINESFGTDLIGKIDYTLLNPSATEDQILELCEKADKLGVKSVCVLPAMVKVAANALQDSEVLVCTVVSFPHGTDTTGQKLDETKKVIDDGADEVDMVLNYPLLKEITNSESDDSDDMNNGMTKYKALVNDVRALVDECHSNTNKDGNEITLKVIVESGLLTDEETEKSTYICLEAGADFIKTSTGMVAVGAQIGSVKIMKDIIDDHGFSMKIKASGGIRTLADLQKFEPYVDRFGVGFAAVDSIFGGEISGGDGY